MNGKKGMTSAMMWLIIGMILALVIMWWVISANERLLQAGHEAGTCGWSTSFVNSIKAAVGLPESAICK